MEMQVFRSKFGRAITVLVWFVLALALIQTFFDLGIWALVESLPAAALIGFGSWLCFYNPRVEFDAEAVSFINLFRTHRIPFSAIQRVDTRWALEVFTASGKITAWGAPAPGRHTALFATKDQGEHLPESSYLLGTVRPGDLVNTDSGAAAAYLRRELEQIEFDGASITTSWHIPSLITLLSLLCLVLVTL
ncbi:MAG: PH domain-containing protein [Actinobacteria bacterium]|nr:PH domain-containing protein [Actinomycetota bacterium]